MYLQHLKLINFRSYEKVSLDFSEKVNLIHGENGVGKTNLLEALHYLGLSKSFLSSNDKYTLHFGAEFWEIEGLFFKDNQADVQIKCTYMPTQGKKAFVNKSPLPSLSALVGKVPIVIFSPQDKALTADGPEERRKFLNNILSQAKPSYLNDYLHYQRVLKQRNALLWEIKKARKADHPALEAWNKELAKWGSRITQNRYQFLNQFCVYVEKAYQQIAQVGEIPKLTYMGFCSQDEMKNDIEAVYWEHLQKVKFREIEQARTLVGPHKDDLLFELNGLEVRKFASHGQHRTFGLALQMAKYFYLKDKLEEKPILLLDDVFGDLDGKRSKIFIDFLLSDEVGQSIITAVTDESFSSLIPFDNQKHLKHEVVKR